MSDRFQSNSLDDSSSFKTKVGKRYMRIEAAGLENRGGVK